MIMIKIMIMIMKWGSYFVPDPYSKFPIPNSDSLDFEF